jgi:DNA-binding transcriptional MerR regulator
MEQLNLFALQKGKGSAVEKQDNIPVKKREPAKKKKGAKVLQKRGRKSFKEMEASIGLIEVPEDEVLFQKQYYSISTVAKWFKVNTSLIRLWENEFDILKPKKNRKGDRLFRPEDVKNIQLIYHLLRQRQFSMEGAKKYLAVNKGGIEINRQLTDSLTKLKSFLLELKTDLGE